MKKWLGTLAIFGGTLVVMLASGVGFSPALLAMISGTIAIGLGGAAIGVDVERDRRMGRW
jgi:hypothetical protein